MKSKLLPAAALLGGMLLMNSVACGAVIVRVAPPAPRVAVVGVAPGPGYIWTAGNWDWRGGRWVWVEGRWMRPPRARAVWVPGAWVERGRGRWGFVRGHWR
ncbi:MAG TPA: YXWGXW repeat-containing protein [Bryobacteraceae bacterium]|nr:YXWGXW repeat-containing protein [Bryobacteraceae bacterium]